MNFFALFFIFAFFVEDSQANFTPYNAFLGKLTTEKRANSKLGRFLTDLKGFLGGGTDY